MTPTDKTREELEEETYALRDLIDALRREKAETDKKNEQLRLIHLCRESTTSQLSQENDRLKANNDNLTITNHTLRRNVAAMNTSLEQWVKYATEGDDQLSKLNLYTERIESRLKSEEAKATELEARLRDLQGRNDDLAESYEDLDEHLTTKEIEAQALQAEYDELKREHEALWKTVHYLDEIVEEDQKEVMRLRHGVLYLKKLWESNELQ